MAKKKQDLTPEERLAAALVQEEEWPYALPDGWKWVRLLGGAATCMDNKRKPVNSKERANRIGEIPYYGATGQVGWIDEYLTNEELILLGEDGAPFLDILKTKAYIINGKSWVNNHAHILKSFMGHIGNLYLMYYLNNFDYRKYVSGTTRLKLTQGKMKNIPVPYPPLSEQRRLVARIESLFAKLDAAKEKVQSVLDSHETRKAALLHDAFTGKLTAKWREEKGVTFESWHSDTLKNLCEKITDGTHHSPPNAETGDYMYITAKNIKETGIELDNVTYVTAAVHEEIYSRCDVQKGDVLYIKDGATTGIATVNTLDEPFSLLSSVAVLRPHKDLLLSSYLKHLLNSAEQKSKMIRNMSGNAITRLTLSKIKATSIKVCSLPEQQQIVRILDRLLAREQRARQAAEETLAAIDRMKQSILARAFRGEL